MQVMSEIEEAQGVNECKCVMQAKCCTVKAKLENSERVDPGELASGDD